MELGIIIGIYMLPWLVGAMRGARNIGVIFVINLFLGWTFVGWVVALAIAASDTNKADS